MSSTRENHANTPGNDPEKGEKDPLLIKPNESSDVSKDDHDANTTLAADIWDTIRLGFPIFLSQISWVGMKTTDTALLGHVSAQALAAAALSDLWTMTSLVFINGRVLGIFVAQAVGAGNPKLGGIYLQVSYFLLSILGVFVFIAWNVTTLVWLHFGSDEQTARDAGYYARVLSFSIPGLIAFGQLAQFFSAQRIMYPEVNASTGAMVLNLIFGLIFVLGFPIPGFDGYGFFACPIVTAIAVYIQNFIMYTFYIRWKKLHAACWGGWDWKEITRERIRSFSKLYFPAAGGVASDFWRVAVIGGIAAKLGEVEVAVFNTSYRIMWIVLIVVNALTMAASIKMSRRLGNMDASGAKQAGDVGIGLSLVVLLIIGGIVLSHIRIIGRIFTEDEEFLSLLEEARLPFSATLFLMNLAVGIEKIPYSMGRTDEVFWMGLIASWGGEV
jgi:MATE family multidrug resistance protein